MTEETETSAQEEELESALAMAAQDAEPLDTTAMLGENLGDTPAIRHVEFAATDEGDAQNQQNIDLLLDVQLELTVELGRTTMSIRHILGRGAGAIVELQKLAGEPVDTGEIVVADNNFGIRIADILESEEANRSPDLR
jgi:flagellar motor switch protein FliN/FliY